jgi:3-oxoacyl-[acyl-carrier protein] reductase
VRLPGKVALVTGAAGGIGAATARRLAREGALVAVTDARADGLEAVTGEIRAARGKALAVLAVNLKGAFLCAQAALPGMRERGWGRVINTSSVGALGNIGQANYAASKAGVIGLTRTLALEYARYGVTVNAVAPGPVMTAMLAGVPEPIKEKIVAMVPVGRIAQPDEIAGVHAFLASDDAAFITGQVVFVDGGASVEI